MEVNLLVICLAAFVSVFLLLSLLAAVMRVLIVVYPEQVAGGTDAAVLAAVTSAVTAAYPGTKVTKVEEIR
jgi:hypothetical protein